jgi:hypothetical protein
MSARVRVHAYGTESGPYTRPCTGIIRALYSWGLSLGAADVRVRAALCMCVAKSFSGSRSASLPRSPLSVLSVSLSLPACNRMCARMRVYVRARARARAHPPRARRTHTYVRPSYTRARIRELASPGLTEYCTYAPALALARARTPAYVCTCTCTRARARACLCTRAGAYT